jgi:hypothetical protein
LNSPRLLLTSLHPDRQLVLNLVLGFVNNIYLKT